MTVAIGPLGHVNRNIPNLLQNDGRYQYHWPVAPEPPPLGWGSTPAPWVQPRPEGMVPPMARPQGMPRRRQSTI